MIEVWHTSCSWFISSNSSLQPLDWSLSISIFCYLQMYKENKHRHLSSSWGCRALGNPWWEIIILRTWELARLEVGSSRAVAQSLGYFTQAMEKSEKLLWRKCWTVRLTFSFMRGWATKIRFVSAYSSASHLSVQHHWVAKLGSEDNNIFFRGHGPMSLHANVAYLPSPFWFLPLSHSMAMYVFIYTAVLKI